MRKLIFGATILLFLVSCGNKKEKAASNTSEVDSIMREDTANREPTPNPIQADANFDSFVYSFASDKALQLKRIKFPLNYILDKKVLRIQQRFWKHDYLFTQQDYFSLLFDHEVDLNMISSINPHTVQVEWVYLHSKMVKKYFFKKEKNGAWMLEAISLKPLGKGNNSSFIEFYSKFANDSLFECRHIAPLLKFITPNPDDDFSVLQSTLDLHQWFAFKPVLPAQRLSNINYGQEIGNESNVKILALKGVGNGFANNFYFRKKAGGEWELYKFEDVSI